MISSSKGRQRGGREGGGSVTKDSKPTPKEDDFSRPCLFSFSFFLPKIWVSSSRFVDMIAYKSSSKKQT